MSLLMEEQTERDTLLKGFAHVRSDAHHNP